mgnify:CR=1 FL=1|jgi:Dehydrogenases with different specificities (related to short-chain alcohol dehydrogenases)
MSENQVIAPTNPLHENIFKLDGVKAIVTGGGNGMGRAISLGLAMFGADVAIADINLANAEETVKLIKEKGREAIAIQMDVSKYEQAEEMAKTVIDKFGRIDLLVNNAGILSQTDITNIKNEEWERMMAINLDGVYYCSKAVVDQMVKQKSGSIINMGSSWSSRAAVFNFSGGGPDYCTSKAAVQALTRSMAQALAKHGVRVNAIAPGVVDTPMHAFHRETLDQWIQYTPLGRLQVADDVVGPIVFLASEAARFVTGQTLHVNGGMLMVD